MTVHKQPLLRVADVVRVIQEEVRNAGGQAFLARKAGLNRPNLNSTLSGRRPPTGDILRAFNLQKVFAYEKLSIANLNALRREYIDALESAEKMKSSE
jgi:hypothetical protein